MRVLLWKKFFSFSGLNPSPERTTLTYRRFQPPRPKKVSGKQKNDAPTISDGFNLRNPKKVSGKQKKGRPIGRLQPPQDNNSPQPHSNHQRPMVGGLGLIDDMRVDGFGAAVEYGDIVDAHRRLIGRVGGLFAREDGEILRHQLE